MKYALVRKIPACFDNCIKPIAKEQHINTPLAAEEHQSYCETLSSLGITLIVLSPDETLPDCPFVEDTAVIVGKKALITRPGAESRRGEVTATAEVLGHFLELTWMEAPATLDGGDVLQVGNTIFVGRTDRTNEAGIEFLTSWAGPQRTVIPIEVTNALHLKSIANVINGNTIVLSGKNLPKTYFSPFTVLYAPDEETERLSFLQIGNHVLLPSDCPETGKLFEEKGLILHSLNISEIRKAQAGLTCLSVLFET